VGPSGCGKSTLLNMIAGLERPDQGDVLEDGRPIDGPGRDRMMMFQESALFPWLDVIGNLMFSLKLKPKLSNKERREVAMFYLQLVGLEKFMHANIHELSGGMKQRVALARALAPNPAILVADEPTGNLDEATGLAIVDLLFAGHAERNTTLVLVTHDGNLAARCDRVVRMRSGHVDASEAAASR